MTCSFTGSLRDGDVEVDPRCHGADHDPAHQETDVEDTPPQNGLTPLQTEMEQGREDEGYDGGGQAAHESQTDLKSRDAHRDPPGDQHQQCPQSTQNGIVADPCPPPLENVQRYK